MTENKFQFNGFADEIPRDIYYVEDIDGLEIVEIVPHIEITAGQSEIILEEIADYLAGKIEAFKDIVAGI